MSAFKDIYPHRLYLPLLDLTGEELNANGECERRGSNIEIGGFCGTDDLGLTWTVVWDVLASDFGSSV